jgi:predicted ester cyclase
MAHDYRAIAPTFIEHDELPGSAATGLDLVKEWVQMSRTALPGAKYRIESVVGSGNEAVCRVRLTGTHRGVLFGIPATGKKVDILLMDWVRLSPTGQITEHWGTMQESKLLEQLGVMPAQTIDLTTPARVTT